MAPLGGNASNFGTTSRGAYAKPLVSLARSSSSSTSLSGSRAGEPRTLLKLHAAFTLGKEPPLSLLAKKAEASTLSCEVKPKALEDELPLKIGRSSSEPSLRAPRSEQGDRSRPRRRARTTLREFACHLPVISCLPPVRVGVYFDHGTFGSPTRFSIRELAASALKASGRAFVVYSLLATDVRSLTRNTLDVIIFPGGRGDHMSEAFGSQGLEAVKTFVRQGGGYIGTCAGAVLAIKHLKFFGEIQTKEPWARGRGDVSVEFTEPGVEALQLSLGSSTRTIFYGQGPIVAETDYPAQSQVLAHFRTEVHSRHTEQTEGQMLNTPAITRISYGSGEVIANSCHPESMTPPMEDIYAGFLKVVIPKA
eukprot:TRINITY_DN16896_c0_g1_i1.p1 TRINITY_DN16896_c0_g1~~TRINITY_DN16896_c0_g1_i1.p1  ORF type:complete len:365 (-),score=38.37 TRINITY_DN16896_c0_g1_i1:312-1406(-)